MERLTVLHTSNPDQRGDRCGVQNEEWRVPGVRMEQVATCNSKASPREYHQSQHCGRGM